MKINKSIIPSEIKKQLEEARKSSFALANLDVTKKNQILYDLSSKLRKNVSSLIWRSVNRKATCLYSDPAIFNTFFKSLRQLDTLYVLFT